MGRARRRPLVRWNERVTAGLKDYRSSFARTAALLRHWRLIDLNQVAAGVRTDRERNRTLLRRLLREDDAERLQALILAGDIVNLERSGRDALLQQAFLERPANGVGVGFQRQLDILISFRRYDGDPSELAANRDVVFLHEAEHLRVEPQRLLLILDHDARQLDSHATTLTDSEACCFSKIAKAGPIRLRHPGNGWEAKVPGTATIERARRRYSDGETPTRLANRVLKLP